MNKCNFDAILSFLIKKKENLLKCNYFWFSCCLRSFEKSVFERTTLFTRRCFGWPIKFNCFGTWWMAGRMAVLGLRSVHFGPREIFLENYWWKFRARWTPFVNESTRRLVINSCRRSSRTKDKCIRQRQSIWNVKHIPMANESIAGLCFFVGSRPDPKTDCIMNHINFISIFSLQMFERAAFRAHRTKNNHFDIINWNWAVIANRAFAKPIHTILIFITQVEPFRFYRNIAIVCSGTIVSLFICDRRLWCSARPRKKTENEPNQCKKVDDCPNIAKIGLR